MRAQQDACKMCGSKNHRLLFKATDINYGTTDEEFAVVKCEDCSLVFISPLPENLARYYPEAYGPHQRRDTIALKPSIDMVLSLFYNYPMKKNGRNDIINKIRHLPKFLEMASKNDYFFQRIPYDNKGKIIDIGCGNGSYLLFLKKLGWDPGKQLFGVEFPNESITRIKNTERLNIIEGDFVNAELPKNFFSVATMRHVLEHFSDPVLAMKKVHDVLKPGGEVLIAIPNFRSLEAHVLKGKWYHIDAPRHLYHFTPVTLTRLLTSTGFEVKRIFLKKSVRSVTTSLGNCGINVPRAGEKYIISNILKISKLFGFSAEILCIAVKK